MGLSRQFKSQTGLAGSTILVAGLLLASCLPLFTEGLFQTLRLSFELERTLPSGEEEEVHLAVFPREVALRRTFVRLSGRLTAVDDETGLPERLTVNAEVVDVATGKRSQRIRVRVKVEPDGAFQGRGKIRKDIAADEMMTITVEPSGEDLAAGTGISVCVDVVENRQALGDLPDCLEAEEGDDGEDPQDAGTTFSSLQDDFLSPTCARAGCHDAASRNGELILEAGQAHGQLVGVASSQRPELQRVRPNDPENSYLIKKLRGDADIQGQRMPRGGPFLSAGEISRFVSWIEGGALDD